MRWDLRVYLQRAEWMVVALEVEYSQMGDSLVYSAFQAALWDVLLLRTSAPKTHLLHQSQHIFKQGERNGCMLAWLARQRSSSVFISCIRDPSGTLLTDPTSSNTFSASF